MDAWKSIWSRFGPRQQLAEAKYSLLKPSSSSEHSSTEHDLEIRGESEAEKPPVSAISWQTEPTFSITIHFNRLRRPALLFFLSLLPSFVYSDESRKPKKLSKTSYLDGLRGVAALFVVIHHYSIVFTPSSYQGWHSDEAGQNNWFFQLPLIRVIHSGRFMVTIFFVISGYVLSYRSLKLAREGKPIQLLDSLASSVFRRWLRLHIPVIISTFIGFLMVRLVLWTNLPVGWQPPIPPEQVGQVLPGPFGTFDTQFWDWFADTKQLCDPFRYGSVYTSKYNINVLWTIPVEWFCSLLVFITVLGIVRTKTWVKFTVLSYLIYWCHNSARWEPATFLSGTLLAELSFINFSPSSSSMTSTAPFSEKPTSSKSISKLIFFLPKLFWTALFLITLFVGSQPQSLSSTSPGYRTLIKYLPSIYRGNPDIFYPSISAPFLILSLENAPHLQRIFTTRFALYLGEISFSLYMLHTMILFSLGQKFVPQCLALTGGWRNGLGGFVGGMVLAMLVLVPVTFWVADVYSRVVDERSVRFARWVGEKCKIKDE